jgi:VanZ family protein
MEEAKPDVSQMEIAPETHNLHHSITALAENEDEPQTPYQLGWRTILALLTLSMGNVCAALSNTVSPTKPTPQSFH